MHCAVSRFVSVHLVIVNVTHSLTFSLILVWCRVAYLTNLLFRCASCMSFSFLSIQSVNRCHSIRITQQLVAVFNKFRSLTPILRRVNIEPILFSHATSTLILFCCLFTKFSFCRHTPFFRSHIHSAVSILSLRSPKINCNNPKFRIPRHVITSLLLRPVSYAQVQ